MDGEWSGRRVLITGALSGMGMASARLLARHGMRLALVARQEAPLRALAAELGAQAIVSELGEWEAASRATKDAVAALGGLDALVNCAGLTVTKSTEETQEDDWQRMLGVNLTGPVAICRAVLPALREGRDPAIVNIASAQALTPPGKTTTAYAATKGGLVSFTRSLAREVGPAIRANALCPGAVRTAVVGEADPAQIAALIESYALGRVGEPDEIAQAVLFLSTPLSSFITGAAIPIDGGRTYH